MDLPATLLDGVLLGGLYALFAAGLSLIFGVMRLVNIAHGDLILLSAFLALTVTTHFPIHPLLSLLLVVPLMAVLGYGLQRAVFAADLQSGQPAVARGPVGDLAHRFAVRNDHGSATLPDVYRGGLGNRRITTAVISHCVRTCSPRRIR